MTRPIAVYDACVLYSAPLRDLLIRLGLAGLVQPKWSEQIHDEWMRSVLATRSEVSSKNLERCRQLMDLHVSDALVTGFEEHIMLQSLPDPDDRHVLAAAIHSEAEVVVTFNLKDFPESVLAPHSIEAVHPDEFIMRLFEDHPDEVSAALLEQRLALQNPPKTVEEFLSTLEQCGIPRSVDMFRGVVEQI